MEKQGMRLGYGLLMIFLPLVGCSDPHQRTWLYTMLRAGSEVDGSEQYDSAPLETRRLLELSGEPDLKMRPQEFLAQIRGDVAYQAYVKNQLQEAFGRYRSHLAGQRIKPQQGPASLADCVIWLYDESRRFKHPYRTSTTVGYGAYLFVVWDSHVVGAACAHHWRSIEAGAQ